MKFVQAEMRSNGTMNIDGYSANKTLKGALKDLARELAKYDKGEAEAITKYIDDTCEMVKNGMINEPGCYYIEAEEVGCASQYNEETDEIETADANWYLYIRYIA